MPAKTRLPGCGMSKPAPCSTLRGHTQRLHTARFNRDGSRIITASDDQTAKLWTASGQLLATLEGHTSAVTSAWFSPDSQLAVTSSEDGTTKVWHVSSAKLLWSIDHDLNKTWSAEFIDRGRRLLTAAGKNVHVWDMHRVDYTPGQLDSFAACRVMYALEKETLRRKKAASPGCRVE